MNKPNMRFGRIALILALIAVAQTGAIAQPLADQKPTCQGKVSSILEVSAVPKKPETLFEVQIRLTNLTAGKISVERKHFALLNASGEQADPLTLDQAKAALSLPGVITTILKAGAKQFGGAVGEGGEGVAEALLSARQEVKEVEERIFESINVFPSATVKRSLYFRPTAAVPQFERPKRFTLVLHGLSQEGSKDPLPSLRLNCALPEGTQEIRTIVYYGLNVSAHSPSGFVTVTVTGAEFIERETTSLDVTIANSGPTTVDVFEALARATIIDRSGTQHAVRWLKSDLPNRGTSVSARNSIHGRLIFPSLPPPIGSTLTLALPSMTVGSETFDVTVAISL